MRQFHFTSIREFVRRLQYRSWIRQQLAQAGGADYFTRLEEDIGAEPGHFRKELDKPLFAKHGSGAGGRPVRWTVTLPSHRLPAGKC